jgi:rhodanese-related sulfurtransferase
MIRAAVTILAPLPLLAVLSCTGTQPEARDMTVVTPKPAAEAKAAALGTPTAPAKPRKGRVTRIMLGDLFKLQQEDRVLIIDVRPAFLFKLGHIPGAVNWPKASFDSQLSSNEARISSAKAANKPVVLYCVDLACPDARSVATRLSDRGHSVAILEGGWDAWKSGDLPID